MTYTNRQDDIDKAKTITSKFYELVMAQKPDSIFNYCNNEIKTKSERQKQMQYILAESTRRFGKIKDIALIGASTKVRTGSKPFGEYRFTYKVLREKYTTKENFILADEDGKIRVFTYGVEKFVD